MDEVFPLAEFEGIKIHDWDKWEDPFRLTMDAYWKYQGEKERKLYAIIDAFQQNNGHLNVTDARYLNALKLFLNGVIPLEYSAHRGFAMVGRPFRAWAARGLPDAVHRRAAPRADPDPRAEPLQQVLQRHARLPPPVRPRLVPVGAEVFFDDAITAGPFEFMIAIGFSFEYVLTNLLFVPFMSGAAYNGDMATVTFGFSAQSDEARHMTLGLEVIKFMLEQDPANVPIVQRWIDKWFWRGYRC
jgi:phenol hydroxylase P3 protein